MYSFPSKMKLEEERHASEEDTAPTTAPTTPIEIKTEALSPVMDDDEDTILNEDPEVHLKPFVPTLEDSSTIDATDSAGLFLPPCDENAVDPDLDMEEQSGPVKERGSAKKKPVDIGTKNGKDDPNSGMAYFQGLRVNNRKKGCPLEAEEHVASLQHLDRDEELVAKEEPTEAEPAEEEGGHTAVDPAPEEKTPVAKMRCQSWERSKSLVSQEEAHRPLTRGRNCQFSSLTSSVIPAASTTPEQQPVQTAAEVPPEVTPVKRRRRRRTPSFILKTRRKKRREAAAAAAAAALKEGHVEPPPNLDMEKSWGVAQKKRKRRRKPPSLLLKTKKKKKKPDAASSVAAKVPVPEYVPVESPSQLRIKGTPGGVPGEQVHKRNGPSVVMQTRKGTQCETVSLPSATVSEEGSIEPPPLLKIEGPLETEPEKELGERRVPSASLQTRKRHKETAALADSVPSPEEEPIEVPPILEMEGTPSAGPVKRRRRRGVPGVVLPCRERKRREAAATAAAAIAATGEIETKRRRRRLPSEQTVSSGGDGAKSLAKRGPGQQLSRGLREEEESHTQAPPVLRQRRNRPASSPPDTAVPHPPQPGTSNLGSLPSGPLPHHSTSRIPYCCHHPQPQGCHARRTVPSVGAVFAQLFEDEVNRLAAGSGYVNMTVDIYKSDGRYTPSPDQGPSTSSSEEQKSSHEDQNGAAYQPGCSRVTSEEPFIHDDGILTDMDICFLLRGRILARDQLPPEQQESLLQKLEQVREALASSQPAPCRHPQSTCNDTILPDTEREVLATEQPSPFLQAQAGSEDGNPLGNVV